MILNRTKVFSDEYERNARLKPALICIIPVSLTVASLGTQYSVAMGAVSGPLTAIGFTYVLSELGRDWGKKKQKHLFDLWGGKPTTVKLRLRDSSINPITLERMRQTSNALIGKTLPTREEELIDPVAADMLYESFGDYLRDHTRDKKVFPLVWKELVSYGFRRNLWGMKPFALSVLICCILLQGSMAWHGNSLGRSLNPTLLVTVFLNICFALFWLAIARPAWVRIPADAYAERLLEASTSLSPAKSKKPAAQKKGKEKS